MPCGAKSGRRARGAGLGKISKSLTSSRSESGRRSIRKPSSRWFSMSFSTCTFASASSHCTGQPGQSTLTTRTPAGIDGMSTGIVLTTEWEISGGIRKAVVVPARPAAATVSDCSNMSAACCCDIRSAEICAFVTAGCQIGREGEGGWR